MITTMILTALISQTPIERPDSYRTVGMATWGARVAITTANHTYTIPVTGTTPACFAYRTMVVVKAHGGALACAWTEDASVVFTSSVATASACLITDASGYDGPGACFIAANTERVDQSPWPSTVRAPGARSTGICSGTVMAPGGAWVYPPCDADADCTGAGLSGGTCTLSMSDADKRHRNQQGCVFLRCQGDTASSWAYVGIEQ